MTITINNKEHHYKLPEIGLTKKAQKFYAQSALANTVNIVAEEGTPEWEQAKKDWREFCALVFLQPHDVPELGEITVEEFNEAVSSFFGLPRTTTPR